jgi:glutathione S-transferase
MHAGFGALRSHCGMNIEADLRTQGQLLWRDKPELRADVARIVQLWSGLLDAAQGGPMLFGEFGIADAYFAPVGTRIRTYGLPVPPGISAYIDRVQALPGVKAWIDAARAEAQFLEFEEPYRLGR